jgi:Bacterial proteasome activator
MPEQTPRDDPPEQPEATLIDPEERTARLLTPGGDLNSGRPGGQGQPPPPDRVSQEEQADESESIQQPAKVMRIGSMVKQLLDEVRAAQLDEASRSRLREIYEQSVRELAGALSPDLAQELDRMALPFDESVPSEAELRVAQAQLVGWLEGLFHGIQAAILAQQMAARAQLDQMRQRGLPPGPGPGPDPGAITRPGTYL